MLQIIVALLIILMMLPFGGGATELHYFTSADKQAMGEAHNKVLADGAPSGLIVNFKGDKNSGYYKIVSEGHELDRDDRSCREILSVSAGLSLDRVECFNNRDMKWVSVDAKNYVAVPAESAPLPQPEGAAVANAVIR